MTRQVIGFHYTLTDPQGNVIDSSQDSTPLLFLEGSGMIIPGLEVEVLKMNKDENKKIDVKAGEAYGEKRDDMIIEVQKSQFPPDATLNVGDMFQVNQDPQMPPFKIVKIEGESITLDGNHPLAGIDLTFDITITEKREATEEEIAHGHAHGVGGHQH